ncbi:DinB family protein [Actinomycetospora lutea]|uniref:DinB family protein n=1 Tax=Actinomycetospora lutea TaxID=663604 RepID=UPI002366ECB6|nr:DinB family protein [Actinomycetospora lutea]MDD7941040.1 DinB family protein [Actinomycetospora lutea]
MDRAATHRELDGARATFHDLHARATPADLRRRSRGTRWNNQQLLFHMLLGYLIMRALIGLARLFSRLPPSASRTWARLLDAGTRAFDVANYLGSWAGGTALASRGQLYLFDRVVAVLHRRLDAETDADLARGMHYPTRWDPFFHDYMTLADLYRFPTRHFDFHRRQLSLGSDAAGRA